MTNRSKKKKSADPPAQICPTCKRPLPVWLPPQLVGTGLLGRMASAALGELTAVISKDDGGDDGSRS
jgi:hypothetical protein